MEVLAVFIYTYVLDFDSADARQRGGGEGMRLHNFFYRFRREKI